MAKTLITLEVSISLEHHRELAEEVARRNATESGDHWRSWQELASVWAGLEIQDRLDSIRERLGKEAIAARDAEPANV